MTAPGLVQSDTFFPDLPLCLLGAGLKSSEPLESLELLVGLANR
jgi:hypothetical protein